MLQGYGDGGFRVAGAERLEGSHIFFPEGYAPWKVKAVEDITLDSLQPVLEKASVIDILIIGCGPRFLPIPDQLQADLRGHGIVLEWMDTGAGCRTFNVLQVEERPAAAALIAV